MNKIRVKVLKSDGMIEWGPEFYGFLLSTNMTGDRRCYATVAHPDGHIVSVPIKYIRHPYYISQNDSPGFERFNNERSS